MSSNLFPPLTQLPNPPHTLTSLPSLNPNQTPHISVPPSTSSYASLLDASTSPLLTKQLHAHVTKTGFHSNNSISTKLLRSYARNSCLEDACHMLDEMPQRNSHSWTSFLTAFFDHGFLREAIGLFKELLFEGFELDLFVFQVLFKISGRVGVVELGRQFHGLVVKFGFGGWTCVGNWLIDMYGKCGSLDEAKRVLENMVERDVVSWNSIVTGCVVNGMVYEASEVLERMKCLDGLVPNHVTWSALVSGFVQNGYDEEALELLIRMQDRGMEPNAQILAGVLPACARLGKLRLGKEFHGFILRHEFMSSSYVVNGLVDVYRRCGDMGSARKIFDSFSVKNVALCNRMIVGYFKSRDISMAREFFDHMEPEGIKRDLISWNSMISGYVDNLMFDEALLTFQELLMVEGIKLSSFTLGSVLTACTNVGSLRMGEEVHCQAIVRGLQSNTFVGSSLIELYSKSKDLLAAQRAFDEVIERDVPTWNSMLAGMACGSSTEMICDMLQEMREDGHEPDVYTWNGILASLVENCHLDFAMKLFCEMQESKLKPDVYTICVMLTACSRFGTLERGRQLHAYSIRQGCDLDVHVGAALMDMYAKCGSLKSAQMAYGMISRPNLVSHNAMLNAYAVHGYIKQGVALLRKMLAIGFVPDDVTFLSVLSSCFHSASVQTGKEFFAMMGKYNLRPNLKHYTCMVVLLSRAGLLHEAYNLIQKMPMEPDSILWGALLGGCVTHGNVELGEKAAQRLMELEPNSTGNYVLMANLYAQVGRWSDLACIRQMMKYRQIHKTPGCSWIEDGDEIHIFLAYDTDHDRTQDIYVTLDNLALHMES